MRWANPFRQPCADAAARGCVRPTPTERPTERTADAGTFAFSGLDPGTYFVEVSRFRYSSVQQSVEVVADCGIFHSMFSGGAADTPLGFTLQQRYEVFSHSFYGFLPPEGWTFGNDGTPEPPQ